MKPNYLIRVASLLILASVALTAQVARQDTVVPLKNWATPLYWQPSQTERQSQSALPQLQFSANAVSSDALSFVAITPCRLVDTRGAAAGFNGVDPFAGPSIASKGTLTVPVEAASQTSTTEPAPCGAIPSIAQAYSFNLTVVPHSGGAVDYVTLWPSGAAQPFVATINDPTGAIVANAAIVPAGTPSGGISVYNDGPSVTDVIIDMNGYFTAPTDLNSNTAIGAGTLSNNTTGNSNTATGSDSMNANTTGHANTADGQGTLQNNTTGIENTAIGFDALQQNNGSGNMAVGYKALQSNTSGTENTASGYDALQNNTTGSSNTAAGYEALQQNATAGANTAVGYQALQVTTAGGNTAVGSQALTSNTTGAQNTALGFGALITNGSGGSNVASGAYALATNTTGSDNTATGFNAMLLNSTGGGNTAFGAQALETNNGGGNNAIGYLAMELNSTGSENEASGSNALQNNTTGVGNTAVGSGALVNNTTGNANIAIGYAAAESVNAGNSLNIEIGNVGNAGDNSVIRIGQAGNQTSAYMAGIIGVGVSGSAVYVNGNGQLGVQISSRRFKEQITDMGDTSSKLLQLRPVNFFYKPEYDDGSHLLQYGLIAEEVADVYPEMVSYDNDGQIMTVKYQLLAPMLLNEVQKQNAQLQSQDLQMRTQAEALRLQQERNQKLEQRLAAVEALLSGQTPAIARPAGSQ